MITVQLVEGGPITEMEERFLDRKDSVVDNDHEHTEIVEYFVKGEPVRAVHRSVHVTLKRGIGLEAILGTLGGE